MVERLRSAGGLCGRWARRRACTLLPHRRVASSCWPSPPCSTGL